MSKLFLGIDGGGSKTEFIVADAHLRPVKIVRVAKGSNPWSRGMDEVLAVLGEGLSQLDDYQADFAACVAGISGCFSPSDYTRTIEAYLQSYCSVARVVGDLPIGFRAATNAKSGIIAIAGSGSSVVHFFSNGTSYVYDGIAAGGRDLGFWLARAYDRGSLQGAGRLFLESVAPTIATGELQTTEDYYHNDELRHAAEHIGRLTIDSEEWHSLTPWIDVVVDRWRYKLYGIVRKFMQKEPEMTTVHLVLSGGLWNLTYIRAAVTEALRHDFDDRVVVLRTSDSPAMGALRMAQELYEATR